jgi:hypothetical protein
MKIIQTFRLALSAPRQYISTRILLCGFYTFFQLRYFGGSGKAISQPKYPELLDFQAIFGPKRTKSQSGGHYSGSNGVTGKSIG